MSMKYGLVLPHGPMSELAEGVDPVEAYENMVRVARAAEDAGFETVWFNDVLVPLDLATRQLLQDPLFEMWTATAAIARDTSRVRIGQMVNYVGLRQPALLAKMASTVDVLSHGRLILGIGAGSPALASQIASYGYDFPETPERMGRLRETAQILLQMWTQEEATFEGKYYQIRGAINQPKGVQQPHIPLLIGGNGEQVTLKLVARFANACNVSGDVATVTRKFEALRAHCETLGRDYESIYRTAGGTLALAETDEQAEAKLPEAMRAFVNSMGLLGSPERVRAGLAAFEEAGVQEMMLRLPESGQPDQALRTIELFAHKVMR